MASIYDLKPAFQNLLRPLCRFLAANGITANQITIAAAVLSSAHGLWIALDGGALSLLTLPITLFLRMALNAIDGMLAREHGQKSQAGAVLNELGDIYADAVLYLPLALIAAIPALPLILFIIIGIMAETAGILAQALTGERAYDGPMGKSDRAFFLGAIGFLTGLGFGIELWSGFLWIAIAFGLVTIWNRGRKAAGA